MDNPGSKPSKSGWQKIRQFAQDEATYFRVHLLCFTIIPLTASAVFFACNGRFHVSYIDSLFLCYSAMTVTGLSTVNLSTITAWQQVILYLLMGIGDITVGSLIMVLIRKHYFKRECLRVESERRLRLSILPRLSKSVISNAISPPISGLPRDNSEPAKPYTRPTLDGNGNFSPSESLQNGILNDDRRSSQGPPMQFSDSPHQSIEPARNNVTLAPQNGVPLRPILSLDKPSSPRLHPQNYRRRLTTIDESVPYSRPSTILGGRRRRQTGVRATTTNDLPPPYESKYHGLGGFPGPLTVAQHLFPKTYRKMERTFTIQELPSLFSKKNHTVGDSGRIERLFMRRNSFFQTDALSDDELERIGGVEYRALRFLSYFVALYFVGTQLISLILIAPWLSATHKYDNVFAAQPRMIQKSWFSLFQVMGAYTGGGMSLVDLGMVPFQRAYLMIFSLSFVILAGNHALPIFLRLLIWMSSKVVKPGSEMDETLDFLLHHPRRCFIYLFPMHQTWFLVACLVLFSVIEWICFLVLNIGLDVTKSLPIGTRIVDGLFQGLAVRASGFAIVPIANLAPAIQFVYVVMMYIAVYPVAMTIRSTNVYEERSLGVFEEGPDYADEEPDLSQEKGTRTEKVGKYLGWHMRRQMSIDIWWLVWGVFFVCIIERANLLDEDKKWFDIFRVLFELVSAFGGIGLSLGLPTDNFSFAGALKPLSKLVIIVVMVRGRHRGLPLAVDRAILLPKEMALRPAVEPVQEGVQG